MTEPTYPKTHRGSVLGPLETDKSVDQKTPIKGGNESSVDSSEPLFEGEQHPSASGSCVGAIAITYGIDNICCRDDSAIKEDCQ